MPTCCRTDSTGSKTAKLPRIDDSKGQTIYEIIKGDADAAAFARLVEKLPRIHAMLQDDGSEYALFVPVNVEVEIPPSQQALEDLVSFHISPHYSTTNEFLYRTNIVTILVPPCSNGPQVIHTDVSASALLLNESSRIIKANIRARNGLVHYIDHPLYPPPSSLRVLESRGVGRFFKALQYSGLASACITTEIKGRTIFAPSDSAFGTFGWSTLDFLFRTAEGQPYPNALVRRHLCPGITFFSNCIWPKNNNGVRVTSEDEPRMIKGNQVQRIPTMLVVDGEADMLDVRIGRCNRLISLEVDGTAKVVVQDLAASDGVVHIIDRLLLLLGAKTEEAEDDDAKFEAFKARMRPYVVKEPT